MLGPCAFQKTHITECNEKNKEICLKCYIFDRCNRKFFFLSFNNLNKRDYYSTFFWFLFVSFNFVCQMSWTDVWLIFKKVMSMLFIL